MHVTLKAGVKWHFQSFESKHFIILKWSSRKFATEYLNTRKGFLQIWPDEICSKWYFAAKSQSNIRRNRGGEFPWFLALEKPPRYEALASERDKMIGKIMGESIREHLSAGIRTFAPLLLRISSAHAIHDVAHATSCISSARIVSNSTKYRAGDLW